MDFTETMSPTKTQTAKRAALGIKTNRTQAVLAINQNSYLSRLLCVLMAL